ncbi:alpha/beta fold hydrolase [Microbacterium terricola]|uniref:Dihydrolipoamide acetyltransferase n=1 Tax=Microbacterium terricola TaxID=344163 RepID=A0ABM8E1P5_9MICO|nr:alpha/beta hydrolase [Microbacterium terricola]UYK40561.1 alpha/beta hydrolase [Microbacterium terricola]BDV31712.1 dihydrolipoamide acetyltransferase [Microbacterium terricola]
MTDAISHFSYQGATLVVEEHPAEGAAGGEAVFVLLHGIGMGRGAFGDLTAHLTPHGRVISLDLPGYGDAPEPDRTPTIERMADIVAALLRDRGVRRPVLIGHSMGTQVAIEAVVRHPGLTDRIVLAGPTVDPRARSIWGQFRRLVHDLAIESPRVLWIGAGEYLHAGPHLRRKMRAMLTHRPEDVYPRVPARTLVLRGASDAVAPRDWCLQVVALLPDASLEEIDGHGHETMIRDAAPAAARIVGFAQRP